MEKSILLGYFFIVLTFLLLLLIEDGHAHAQIGRQIQCFACEGRQDEPCADTFQSSGVQVMSCNGSCVKTNNKYKEQVKYSRYCTTDKEGDGCTTTTYDTGSHIKCICSTDYCNTGPQASAKYIVALMPVLIFFVLVLFK